MSEGALSAARGLHMQASRLHYRHDAAFFLPVRRSSTRAAAVHGYGHTLAAPLLFMVVPSFVCDLHSPAAQETPASRLRATFRFMQRFIGRRRLLKHACQTRLQLVSISVRVVPAGLRSPLLRLSKSIVSGTASGG